MRIALLLVISFATMHMNFRVNGLRVFRVMSRARVGPGAGSRYMAVGADVGGVGGVGGGYIGGSVGGVRTVVPLREVVATYLPFAQFVEGGELSSAGAGVEGAGAGAGGEGEVHTGSGADTDTDADAEVGMPPPGMRRIVSAAEGMRVLQERQEQHSISGMLAMEAGGCRYGFPRAYV
ncbi:hypothetical protein B484DRAFT_391406, partial [Ochromonadaceae sp. CCMP2298]